MASACASASSAPPFARSVAIALARAARIRTMASRSTTTIWALNPSGWQTCLKCSQISRAISRTRSGCLARVARVSPLLLRSLSLSSGRSTNQRSNRMSSSAASIDQSVLRPS